MVELTIKKNRIEIERELKSQGYVLDFSDRDDQIWTNAEQDELLFISWINGSMWVYERKRKVKL